MASEAPIPPELIEYVRRPLAEGFTVEIFDDLHHVLDQYIVELAIERGSTEDPQDIVQDWEQEHREEILQLVDSFEYLEEKQKSEMAVYLEDYFDLSSHPALIKILQKTCR